MTTTESMNMFAVLSDPEVVTTSHKDLETKAEVNTNPRSLDDSEFPVLGTKPVKKVTKFTVASSYIDDLKHRKFRDDARTHSFQDKTAIAKTLTCTKACQYVLKKVNEETGEIAEEYGVCYREVCTFAHSMAELQLPPCAFGEKCNRRNGTKNFKTGQVDKTHKCQFFHPGESQDQFYTRTGRDKPDLPATSEKSRCPKPKVAPKVAPKVEETKVLKRQDAIGSVDLTAKLATGAWAKPCKVESVPKTVVIRVPKDLAQQAMEMALSRGLTDFSIETF